MRDFSKTRFLKRIAITEQDLIFVNTIRKKKSGAGMLELIINFYKESKHQNYGKSDDQSDK